MTRLAALLASALMLTACARSEPANPDPGEDLELGQRGLAEQDTAMPEDPATAGNWEASASGEAQSVTFRGGQNDILLTISCDLRGGLVVQRPGLVARGNLALMQLRTADIVRRLAVNAAAGQQPLVEARIPYNDQLIPALLSFDQPLEVRYESLDTLILPPNPMVGDLVRTCQQASTSGPTAAPAPSTAPPADNAAQPATPPAPAPATNQQ